MKIEEFTLPEFILGEFPIKDKSFNDERMFIMHRGISLIEIIPEDIHDATLFFDDKVYKQYTYFGENYTLVYHTNNVDYFNLTPIEVLDQAFSWYREYLIWEDTKD